MPTGQTWKYKVDSMIVVSHMLSIYVVNMQH